MKRLSQKIYVFTALSVIFLSFGLWCFYTYELSTLPQDRSPVTKPIPAVALNAFWFSETKSNSMTMVPMSPWNWIRAFTGEGEAAFPPSSMVASSAARFFLARSQKTIHGRSWPIKWCIATIWISRNWTAEEAITTILHKSYFGHGFYGIEQASQGYFGHSVDALSVSEAVILAGLVCSPTINDPWSQPQHANTTAMALLANMDPNAKLSYKLLPAPVNACKK